MKYIYFIVGLPLALASCAGDKPGTENTGADSTGISAAGDTIIFTVENTDEQTYCSLTEKAGLCMHSDMGDENTDSLTEAAFIREFPTLVKRSRRDLVITTKAGNKTFTNVNSDMDDVAFYDLTGINPNVAVVHGRYMESHDYNIVDLTTGQVFITWGPPVFNAVGNMAIAGNTDLFAAFTPNGIQLYTKVDNTWKLAMQRELDDWGPQDLYWLSDSVVLSKKNIMDEKDSVDMLRTEYVKIILKKETR